jgi:flagellar motility protein MotE (MotC chaperone)
LVPSWQSKKKAAEDALWADEANNKHALKQAELEKKKQAEAEKRALLKSLEAQENAELEVRCLFMLTGNFLFRSMVVS